MRPYVHKVQYYETDKMGITHHANYIRWMEEARIDYLEQIGWSFEKLEAMGLVSPVMSVQCDYKNTSTFPDEISIQVYVEGYKGVRIRFGYEMRNAAGSIVCIGHSEHCFLNEKGVPVRLQKTVPELDDAIRKLTETNPS